MYALGNAAARNSQEELNMCYYVLSNAERELLTADPNLALYMQRKREQDQSQFSDVAADQRLGSVSSDSADSFLEKSKQEREDEVGELKKCGQKVI